MILKQWKVPWEIVERVEDIRKRLHQLDAKIIHIFREENTVADSLDNEVIEKQDTKEYHIFQELLSNIWRLLNMDKAQVPNLRIRNKYISIQRQEQWTCNYKIFDILRHKTSNNSHITHRILGVTIHNYSRLFTRKSSQLVSTPSDNAEGKETGCQQWRSKITYSSRSVGTFHVLVHTR
ncbi:hypothetical protein H5410_046826 [Solanum commersonii]|uniref:Uncharacterized protein n=1 Tax=Solanum commersonii TaxID=4109 RepID=A0A9J5XHH7_SOLCO|nr:hypothetical protein H5410_046826 [Solanum commersonii]